MVISTDDFTTVYFFHQLFGRDVSGNKISNAEFFLVGIRMMEIKSNWVRFITIQDATAFLLLKITYGFAFLVSSFVDGLFVRPGSTSFALARFAGIAITSAARRVFVELRRIFVGFAF